VKKKSHARYYQKLLHRYLVFKPKLTVLSTRVSDFLHRGEGGAASWGGGAVDGGSVNAFLTAALTRVMRAAVPIPVVGSASVVHSAAVGGSVVGVVRPL